MTHLITRVLAYARVGAAKIMRETCESGAALAEALAIVSADATGCEATITHAALPAIAADRTLFVQLLQNLLENALKYRTGPPRIDVAALRAGSEWTFSIRDNGIGIAPEHLEDVFLPFTRLHKTGHAGTGLGLATCRRIVERHGGRIWVESKPDEGSVFRFTIPD